jgi:hypothetical protein
MNVKIGDKVKFLNATGGGIVSKILDSKLVSVSIEGGFEIPVQAAELIVIQPADAGGRFFQEKFNVPEMDESDMNKAAAAGLSGEPLPLSLSAIRSRKAEDVLLAFIPHDQKWLITGDVDVCIINNTSFDLLYNLYRKEEEGTWTGVDYGSLTSGTSYILATVQRDELASWTEGTLQFLFHRERCAEVPQPFNAGFSIAGKKFFTENSYKPNPLVTGRAIVLKMLSMDPETESVVKIASPQGKPETPRPPKDDFILKHRTEEGEAVVDLHIDELTDDPKSFSKPEILDYQKRYFQRCLESAMANGFRKIIFIHGVGNGVLRQELTGILEKQEGIEFFDAPMNQYGTGAVEVRVRYNRRD